MENSSCLAFWRANQADNVISSSHLDQFEFALVHDSSLAVFASGDFKQRIPYFRLRHESVLKEYNCPSGFAFRGVKPEGEIYAVANFIQRCYPNMKVSPAVVRGWLDHPVYDPDLWVWLVDEVSGKNAALGIAEFDPEVPEASLEWIQVLPEYQHRGLGSAIVGELLGRVDGRVLFTTVAGEVNNTTQPERHYRKCGFTGSDIWWLLKS